MTRWKCIFSITKLKTEFAMLYIEFISVWSCDGVKWHLLQFIYRSRSYSQHCPFRCWNFCNFPINSDAIVRTYRYWNDAHRISHHIVPYPISYLNQYARSVRISLQQSIVHRMSLVSLSKFCLKVVNFRSATVLFFSKTSSKNISIYFI